MRNAGLDEAHTGIKILGEISLEKNHVVPTSWQNEALARYGVSREVPSSALKGETVPDSLPATPKVP